MRKQKIYYSLLAAVFFLSCQTAPKFSDPLLDGSNFIPLEPGASAYIFADVQQARPVLDFFPIPEMNDKYVIQIIDKTKSAVMGIYPAESGRQFQLAGWGNYPSGRGGLALGMNKSWKKNRSAGGYSYWYSEANRLSVNMSTSQIYASTSRTTAPSDPFGAGIEFPDAFNEFRRGSFLACWLDTPGPLLNTIFQSMGLPLQIPVELIFISLAQANSESAGAYEALIRMKTPSASQARGLAAMISMARLFTSGNSGGDGLAALTPVLFANAPVQDSDSLIIKTAPLGEKEIALLFNLFLVNAGK
ncbi:MAG: hypothetical protein LBH97_06025 [Treponema sp.]|jgi:hypothetical protein|nr:hypothetical protein [Treponema sp.]